MQVDPGGLKAATTITAANSVRKIIGACFANFPKDTSNFVDTGTWTDISADVLDVRGDMAIHPPEDGIASVGQSASSSMSLTLRNSSGKYSPNRTDGANYANTRMDGGGNNKGIYETPIVYWQGQLYSGQTTAATLFGLINSSITAFDLAGGSPSLSNGLIIQIDSEKMLIIRGGTSLFVSRAFDGSTAASHNAGAGITILGSMCVLFTGIIHRPAEASYAYNVTWECLDRSYMMMQNKGTTTTTQDVSTDTFITTILAQLPSSPPYTPIPVAQRSLDTGIYPLRFALMDDESCWVEGSKVASADGGYLHFSPRGKLRYWNPQHLLLAEPDVDSVSTSHTTSQYTIDTLNMLDLTLSYEYDNIFSSVIVEYSPRQITPRQAVYTTNEVISIPPGGTYSTVARFNYPVAASSVVTPVGGAAPADGTNDTRDYVATNGSGTDITASVTLSTFTAFGQRANITFSNASTQYTAHIVRFQIRAQPLLGSPAKEARTPATGENTTTPAQIPARTKTISQNWYIQHEAQAKALSQFLADRYKTARAIMASRGVPGIAQLENGDLVTVSEVTALSASKTAFVMKIAWRVDGIAQGRQRFLQDMDFMDFASLFQQSNGANYYIVGTSSLSSSKVYSY